MTQIDFQKASFQKFLDEILPQLNNLETEKDIDVAEIKTKLEELFEDNKDKFDGDFEMRLNSTINELNQWLQREKGFSELDASRIHIPFATVAIEKHWHKTQEQSAEIRPFRKK